MRTTKATCLQLALLVAPQLQAQTKLDFKIATDAKAAVDKGLQYLNATQHPEGGWEVKGKPHMAITALVVKAFAQDPAFGPGHPVVERATRFVLRSAQSDGGYYVPGEGHENYQASVVLMALASLERAKYKDEIVKLQEYLKRLQWDDGEGYESSHVWYGGAGYGGGKRPDLSNTQMMLEALHQSGLSAEDPVYKRAMVFISRSQMLPGGNDQPFAAGGDGGFIYSPANNGESKAGVEEVEGKSRLRSYGSMTYSGFKSLLYANVGRDDPRIKAAVEWIKKNYTLDHNPNMPGSQSKEGMYYFYYVFARAMKAWGEDIVVDARGAEHQWRSELCEKLISLQNPDGSWVNQHDRWFEGSPHLVTGYAVLALQTSMQE